MQKLFALILLLLSSNANAIPVVWTLNDVIFSDGQRASGSFIFDADTVVSGTTTTPVFDVSINTEVPDWLDYYPNSLAPGLYDNDQNTYYSTNSTNGSDPYLLTVMVKPFTGGYQELYLNFAALLIKLSKT